MTEYILLLLLPLVAVDMTHGATGRAVSHDAPAYRHCGDIYRAGHTEDGVYEIILPPEGRRVSVYCDMSPDGPWMVMLRRLNGTLDFYRNWGNYTDGFGSPDGEGWIGNSALHTLTSANSYDLRVDLWDDGDEAYAIYPNFQISDENSDFVVDFGDYSGTAGDSLEYHRQRPFSTYDHGNTLCADEYTGAWWYRACHTAHLTGEYTGTGYGNGVIWSTWKGFYHSIQHAEMKLRAAEDR